MGMAFACFYLDGYNCPVVTEVFIICASGKENKILQDFDTRTGQEYKACDLLEGRSRISVSSSMEVVGSNKNELDE